MRTLAIFLLVTAPVWALTECQTKWIKILNRASPLSSTHQFQAEAHPAENRLPSDNPIVQKLTHPEFQGARPGLGDFQFSVVSQAEMAQHASAISSKGIWLIFSPSPSYAKIQSGHFSTKVEDTFFARDIEGAYPQGILTGKDIGRLWVDENPFLLMQYLELSDASVKELKKYFEERVAKHKTDPEYKTEYVDLPYSKDAANPCGENCTTFLFTPYVARWVQKYPALEQVQKEIGSVSVSDLPFRQVHNNTLSQAYRGSVLVVSDPAKVEKELLDGTFNDSPQGFQMFFDGSVKKLNTNPTN